MKIKLGLKHYDVIKIESFKDKIKKKDKNKILYYPYTNTITTYFNKENYLVVSTNLDYQIKYLYHNVTKNKIIHIKENKQKIHLFLIPTNIKEKLVIGSVLKLTD